MIVKNGKDLKVGDVIVHVGTIYRITKIKFNKHRNEYVFDVSEILSTNYDDDPLSDGHLYSFERTHWDVMQLLDVCTMRKNLDSLANEMAK